MAIRKLQFRRAPRRHQGFSLIEVLIAAVILAVGMLALASLQAGLTRSAAESRARSQVAAFVDLAIERQRARAAVNFAGIPDAAVVTAAEVTAAGTGAGVSNLAVTMTSTHFEGRSGGFVECDAACGAALTKVQPQYKQLQVNATWNDITGAAQRFSITTILSPRSVEDSRILFDSPNSGNVNASRRPVVRTNNPVGSGVIPIAIGNNTDTAATNPRPVVAGRNNNQSVVGTSFQILTFKNEDAQTVQNQARIETKVIGCTCSPSAAPTGAFSGTAQWPAYWNGDRYVVYAPDDATAQPPGSTRRSGPVAAAIQDDLCTDCCRDHHDDNNSTHVKFDPFRSDQHLHYKVSAGTLVPALPADNYIEACRMVRVGGFWRTTADMQARHFGLLATTNSARLAPPATAAAASYEGFVIDYLVGDFAGPNSVAYPEVLFDSAGLNAPAEIEINRPAPVDNRYLHARGLYVDNLEPKALERIARARTDCPTGMSAGECLLPYLPFTPINVTELAFWLPSTEGVITVSNSSVFVFDPDQPGRGRVNALAAAIDNAEATAVASMTKSNAGVAALVLAVDPEDLQARTDGQVFRVSPAGTPGTGNGAFSVVLLGLPQTGDSSTTNEPAVNWAVAPNTDQCGETYSNNGDKDPNPYSCQVFAGLPGPTVVQVTSYNRQATGSGNANTSVSCTSGAQTLSTSMRAREVSYCENYRVDGATSGVVPGVVLTSVNDGRIQLESTSITFATLATGASVSVNFSLQNKTPAPATCTLANNGSVNGATFQNCL